MSAIDAYYMQMQQNDGWRQILASFARFVAPQPQHIVLDIGTGPGALVNIFREQFEAHAFGIDASHHLARNAQHHYAENVGQFVTGRLPELPLQSDSIDVITATNVLYLLNAPQQALKDIVRVLKVGGTFAMLNPSTKMSERTATELAHERQLTGFARQNFIEWGRIAETNHRWSLQAVHDLFSDAGLTLIDHQYRIGIGLAFYVRGTKLGG